MSDARAAVTATVAAGLPAPELAWRDRWSGEPGGAVVLDLGRQPPGDLFPLPDDPPPDPEHPLRMVISTRSGLVQLESDATTPDERRDVEPAALVDQAEAAVAQAEAAGLVRPGTRVLEYPSPHGGSWAGQLAQRGAVVVDAGPVDLVVDIFGLMHAPDQRAALTERRERLTADGVILLQYHTVAAILRAGMWNALRHGHFAYYSTPVLVAMGRELGLVAVGCWQYPLYGGTVLLALARQDSAAAAAGEHPDVTALVGRELADGVTTPERVASLGTALQDSVTAIRDYLRATTRAGLRVAGYGAASRTSALLRCARITRAELLAVADVSAAKQGRCMPGDRIPIVSPADLLALRPDRVLLFVPDLLAEVRAALPEVEAHGGRWVVLDPMPREVAPVSGRG